MIASELTPRMTRQCLLSRISLLAGLAAMGWGMRIELESSPLQSTIFTTVSQGFSVSVEPGTSVAARFPQDGPYDERLGYTRIPAFVGSLGAQGYVVERQARLSPGLLSFIDLGGFPVYREKSQAGLTILDRWGDEVFRARFPERVFADFESIPRLVVETLLFIENRELMDLSSPTRNPAVEWDRFVAASVNTLLSTIIPTGQRFGGSTLATQIEKCRHSPDGRTVSPMEKLRQIASASARAYQDGPDTRRARKRIVLDYINSTPLSARPLFGEVIGLGDGLYAWYGTALAEMVVRLRDTPSTPEEAVRRAQVYKQVLSLLLAQRRPSYYLLAGRDELSALSDEYLGLLVGAGIIDAELRDAALAQPLVFAEEAPAQAETAFAERKFLNAARARLVSMLKMNGFYDLDRLDLRIETSVDAPAQRAVTETLGQLTKPEGAKQAGLFGERLLHGDPAGVVYSVTLYERTAHANLVRVQADNMDRPLDVNEGGKFDLGSTAKLRTLTTYLEILAGLHGRYSGDATAELRAAAKGAADPLTRWAADFLAGASDRSLGALVDAALDRTYSANPGETFFTGRGAHTFANFDKTHHGRFRVREAFRHSVNLVFIRMMRDVVKYYQAQGPIPLREVLADRAHPARRGYLERFADMEGTVFLDRFYRRYGRLEPEAALEVVAGRTRRAAYRLTTVFRSVRPQASVDELARFLERHLPGPPPNPQEVQALYDKYGMDRFNLNDRGYIARIHPLELWLVGYLQAHPTAQRSEILAASVAERQEVYQWLLRSKRKRAADSRIRIMAEEDAFKQVHRSWQHQGYPFASLVPSLASAIGSSADRPAALAELIGIILNDGVRLPTVRIPAVHFAEGTPYETHLSRPDGPGERVLPKEVAMALRGLLAGVVANGTARRLAGVYTDSGGNPLQVGGKTGTGDEHSERYGSDTAAGKEKEVSRSAAFAFFIGDRFFGVVTAHVPGPNAKGYRFTSALPTQVLKALEPALAPLIRGTQPLKTRRGDRLLAQGNLPEGNEAIAADTLRTLGTRD